MARVPVPMVIDGDLALEGAGSEVGRLVEGLHQVLEEADHWAEAVGKVRRIEPCDVVAADLRTAHGKRPDSGCPKGTVLVHTQCRHPDTPRHVALEGAVEGECIASTKRCDALIREAAAERGPSGGMRLSIQSPAYAT